MSPWKKCIAPGNILEIHFDILVATLLTRLFMFVLDEELDSPAYPEQFQEVEVKDEPVEYDAVSCNLFYHPNSMLIFIIF